MTSDRQIAANRRNAQRSTGPRTPAGKATVSVNAVKHGLTARDVVLPTESAEEFESFRTGLLAALDPVGDLEGVLAERIVTLLWRLRRVPMFEAALHRRGLKELIAQNAEEACNRYETFDIDAELLREMRVAASDRQAYKDAQRSLVTARAALDEPSFNLTRVLELCSGPFTSLWRHELALSRSFDRALHELQRLQAARAGEHVAAPSVVDVNVNGPEQPSPTVPVEDQMEVTEIRTGETSQERGQI